MREYKIGELYSNSKDSRSLNMDLWNNQVGREYAKKVSDRKELLKNLHKALSRDELIISLEDERKFKGADINPVNKSKPVIILKENESGRNEVFYDLIRDTLFTREEFVTKINKK